MNLLLRPHSGTGRDENGQTWSKGVPDNQSEAYVSAYLDVRAGDVVRFSHESWRVVISDLAHEVSCTRTLKCWNGETICKVDTIIKMHPIKADEWLQQQGIKWDILSK